MKKFLLLAIIGCFGSGGVELWNALFHGKPVEIAVPANAAPALPPFFTLTNLSIEALDAIYFKQLGQPKAFVPVRASGAKDDSPIHILLITADPALLKLQDTPENNKLTVDILKDALTVTNAWRAKKQFVGVPDSHSMKDKERQELIKAQPLLAPDFVIVTDGDGPSLAVGVILLAAGVGLVALWVLLGREKPTSTAVAEPPKL